MGEVPPVHGEVLELEGVNSYKDQHGVSNHKPPEGLQEFPPEIVVNLQKTLGADKEKRRFHTVVYFIRSNLLYLFRRPKRYLRTGTKMATPSDEWTLFTLQDFCFRVKVEVLGETSPLPQFPED